MLRKVLSSSWYVLLIIIILAELVLSAPQGYDYYANQQRYYYAQQRAAQAQRIQAQRLAAQNRYYHQQLSSYRTPSTTTRRPFRVSKADAENAKFLGSKNQESIESGKTFKKKANKLFGGGYGPGGYGNGCYFRNANQEHKSEGRVFWDFNVYNVYPNGGCGGGFGGGYPGGPGGFGGGLADPIYGDRPVRGFFQNWLGLFLPGGALSGVNRPYQGPSQSQSGGSSSIDPVDYDSNLGGTGSGADSSSTNDGTNSGGGGSGSGGGLGAAGGNNNFGSNGGGMPNLTPGQIVGGVANTVNSVIQTLSTAPVFG
ncbi:keratin, type I cytoskeletal 9-like [Eupeodes corollae]|uniref:keratin, type I cytoskeletal 9-like n=1 Tax=Eupeodes corollae TaxID=290404 RepID=UPI002493420A|nr:keratin, type I cytoskeletal 9-like [Eupeodes corollae]